MAAASVHASGRFAVNHCAAAASTASVSSALSGRIALRRGRAGAFGCSAGSGECSAGVLSALNVNSSSSGLWSLPMPQSSAQICSAVTELSYAESISA